MRKEIAAGLNDVFFPSGIKCIVCDDDIPEGARYPFCKKCAPEKNLSFCLTCGHNLSVSGYCSRCKNTKWYFKRARAPFVYSGDIKDVIHKFKYGNGRYIAKEMSVYLAEIYYEQSLFSDLITFVPMFLKKKKRRGYNQSELLARALGDIIGCDVAELLIKVKQTKSNAGQNAAQRAESVKDTIEIMKGEGGAAVDIRDKRILLIDDVFTTGATANECAKALMSAKAAEVNVLTLATAREKIVRTKGNKLKDMPSV